ncbi:amidase [Oceaniglobus trochenteri]|uniref:amidase n=1 Tax=Oceaniglobus trochenteri TaxID=2763260 RepID=UPI001CFFC26D|nr:amidase [Oceaniglobus trochenteri]
MNQATDCTAPCDLPIHAAGAALRAGRFSAVALTEMHLARIAARNPAVRAFVHVAGEEALRAARRADAELASGQDRGPLHGIPFAIKDVIDLEGWPIRWGSRLQADRVAKETAPVVRAMLDAGAIPLGVVATYEMATVGPDDSALAPPATNPWNGAHVTGGSSSGSAAAVAAGMVRIALGTDTGGSIRSPAAYCGVVGLKPSHGALPLGGVMPLSPSLDHAGPIGRTVGDAALAFFAMTGREWMPGPVEGISLAYGRAWAEDEAAHPALLPMLDAAASVLSLCGARIALADLPPYAAIEAAGCDILLAEGFAAHGPRVSGAPDAIGPMARASIQMGQKIGPAQVSAARAAVPALRATLDALLSRHAALILPTVMAPAPPFSAFNDGKPVWTAMRTIPFNMTGHPALSVPMGLADGLPLGLQIVGRRGDETTLLRIGAAFEAATDHAILQPALA